MNNLHVATNVLDRDLLRTITKDQQYETCALFCGVPPLLTKFRILCGEEWSAECGRLSGQTSKSAGYCNMFSEQEAVH